MIRHRPAALCLLCLAAVLFLPTSPCACCRHTEGGSLFFFLSNISTPADRPLTSWVANTDCCLWEGISCSSDGFVTRLWLPHRGLGGTLSPSSLDGLPRLAELNLSHNGLSGTLPQGLLWSDHIVVLDVSYNLLFGQLPAPLPGLEEDSASRSIRSLSVSSNHFTGEFPRLWRVALELRAVNASNNSFSGSLPLSICSVAPRLNFLDFSLNKFDGVIPPGLGNCSELLVLDAGFNNLLGPLPADLYNAIQLRRLSLPFNRLSGVLHGEQISKFANLVVLDLGGNSLRWETPEAIGKLTNLEVLHLNQNQLSRTFPSALSNCTKLRSLDLRGNNFTGDISSVDFSPLFKLTTLDLANNYFAGEFPASIYSCTSLTVLRLANNRLRGRVPPGMHRLPALSHLSLSFNRLEGIGETFRMLGSSRNLTVVLLGWNFHGEAMPDADADWPVDAFMEVRLLSLAQCQLTGKFPSWIARLRKLKMLDLSGNQLSGTIPGWLGSLPQLFYMSVSDNLLSGELPSAITGMMALQSDEAAVQVDHAPLELPIIHASRFLYRWFSSVPPAINLSNNHLSGTIPPGIGLLHRLHALDLSSNNFSGEIPPQLGDLSELEIFNLSSNHLSGPIPNSLTRLHFLSSFSVSSNDLSGTIPSGGQFLTFPSSSFQGNDGLCGFPLPRPCTNTSSHLPETEGRPRKKIPAGIIVLICLGSSSILIIMMFICAMTIYTHSIP